MKVVVFGDGAWASRSLRRLDQAGHEVLAVVLRRRPSSADLEDGARSMGVEVLQPSDVNAPDFVRHVGRLSADVHLSIAYDRMFRSAVRETAKHGVVNLHAGKLPAYRGRNVINWALINGEPEIGITAHFVDDGIDTGDVLLQRTLPIGWTDTYGDVLGRVVDALPDLAADSLDALETGRYERRPQPVVGTYFGGRAEGDEWLDWADTSRNLHNKVRAISRPGPGARTVVDGQTVIVWRAFYDPAWPKYIATPGQVVGRDPRAGALVKTGDSTLLVQEAQGVEGSVVRPSWRIGTRLGSAPPGHRAAVLERLETVEGILREVSNGARRAD